MALTGPTIGQVVNVLQERTCVPASTLKTMARSLGEAGLLGPRGGRGRNAPRLPFKHVARVLIAVMAYRTGYAPTPPQVTPSVSQIQDQEMQGLVQVAGLESTKDLLQLDEEFVLAPAGSFLDAIAYAIKVNTDLQQAKHWKAAVEAVGLSYVGPYIRGCLYLAPTASVSAQNLVADRTDINRRVLWGNPLAGLYHEGIHVECLVFPDVFSSLADLFIRNG